MWPNPLETADLITFTEKILSGKLRFLCSDYSTIKHNARYYATRGKGLKILTPKQMLHGLPNIIQYSTKWALYIVKQ